MKKPVNRMLEMKKAVDEDKEQESTKIKENEGTENVGTSQLTTEEEKSKTEVPKPSSQEETESQKEKPANSSETSTESDAEERNPTDADPKILAPTPFRTTPEKVLTNVPTAGLMSPASVLKEVDATKQPLPLSPSVDPDEFISDLVLTVESDRPLASASTESQSVPISQASIDEAKKYFKVVLSGMFEDVAEQPDRFNEALSILRDFGDLSTEELNEVKIFQAQFQTILSTFQTPSYMLKETENNLESNKQSKATIGEQVIIDNSKYLASKASVQELTEKEKTLQENIDRLSAELVSIKEARGAAEKENSTLRYRLINLGKSRNQVLTNLGTLENQKKAADDSLSLVQFQWERFKKSFNL
ncbi:uncharacterized protein LOC132299702 isoform X1 [Cornus florida]|uniref:uncharacterized protein LOC132299702 isoform X1 n=1 Tax=Cornus florida TaxID=4283 RepID=UPI0028989763|nr:uncharacterized protein LOC132299702 isoform X1 [Cornus florida]